MELIIGQEPEERPPVTIWTPGTIESPPKALILPRHLQEPEETDPEKALEKLILGANKNIGQISQLPLSLIAASMQPRSYISYTETDPEQPFKQTFSVSLGVAYLDEFEEINETLAKQLQDQGVKKIPRLVQTAPEYVAVFFHPFEGHQIGIKRK